MDTCNTTEIRGGRKAPDQPKTFLQRDNWMRAVLADGTLSFTERAVAIRIALYLHVDSGRCAPGYDALAESVGVSPRSAFRLVAALERAGWIAVDGGPGRGRLSNLHLITPDEKPDKVVSGFDDEKPDKTVSGFTENLSGHDTKTCQVTTEKPDSCWQIISEEKSEEKSEDREESLTPSADGFSDEGKQGLGGEGKKGDLFESTSSAFTSPESGLPPSKPKRARAGAEIAAAFESFWAIYPRKVAKLAALKAFESAIAGGATAAAIIAGAERYRVERANEEPRYTKHPSTWLRAGCWEDEPPPGGVGPPLIDGATGNVIPSAPAPRPNGRDSYEQMMDRLRVKLLGGRHVN